MNNIFLNGNSPLLSSLPMGTTEQIAQQRAVLLQRMQQLDAIESGAKSTEQPKSNMPYWDELDSMTNELSEVQMEMLQGDVEYKKLNDQLSLMLQGAIVLLAKPVVENSENGRSLLKELVEVVKAKKGSIIKQTNEDMRIFAQFQEYAKLNPQATYAEFIKTLK